MTQMDISTAVAIVTDNMAVSVVAIALSQDGNMGIALCEREHPVFEHEPFCTVAVNSEGPIWGHYDQTYDDALDDFNFRVKNTLRPVGV